MAFVWLDSLYEAIHPEIVLGKRRLEEGSSTSIPSWGMFLIFMSLLVFLYFILKIVFFVAGYWQKQAEERMMKALAAREKVKDSFRRDYGYNWDFVLVFPITEYTDGDLSNFQREYSHKRIMIKLANAGFHTKLFFSVQNDEMYLKVRVPLPRLLKQAKFYKFRLCCEPTMVANLLQIGNKDGPEETHWGPIHIVSDNVQTEIPPYDFIYAPFRDEFTSEDRLLYKKYNGALLRGVDRVKLIYQMLIGQEANGGCELNIYKLKKEGVLQGFFPLHDEVELRDLEKRWFIFWQLPSSTPIARIKDYFGEKIGLFFGYLSHYTTWISYTCFFGFVSWCDVAANDGDPNVYTAPFYAAFMSLWATLYLDSWKREEVSIAMKWGTYGVGAEAAERPEYIDHPSVYKDQSPVDGRPILVFPRTEAGYRQALSVTTSIFFVMCVIATIIGTISIKFVMEEDQEATQSASLTFSFLNAVVVAVMSNIYTVVAKVLTNLENHRTDIEYEDALIGKTFIVQFINSFAAMFFIAFAQPFLGNVEGFRHCESSCYKQIQVTLDVLFFSKLTTGSALALIVPYINKKIKEDEEFSEVVDTEEISFVERQFVLEEYDPDNGSFNDFADYSIQFAYITMFVSASPLSTLIAYVNNYMALRINAWQFCHLRARPMPQSVESIGTWYTILEIISYCAIFTSAGLIAVTSTLAIDVTWFSRVWIFIGMSTGTVVIKSLAKAWALDIAEDVQIQLKRNKFILDKLYFNKPDDDDSRVKADVMKLRRAQYAIRVTDDDPL